MEQRDVHDVNPHLKVQFEELFGEPDSPARSIDCVWRCSYKCFNGTLSCCYKTLTVLCAIPLAFCWACDFASLMCCHIWYWTPYVKNLSMNLVPTRKIIALYLDTYCGPMCEVCALCFSRIGVTNRTG